jgi:hypothetical protein
MIEHFLIYSHFVFLFVRYGLARRAMQIYDRAVRHVHEDDKPFVRFIIF